MTFHRTCAKALAALVLGVAASASFADSLTWSLSGVSFSDGTQASGFFTYDTSTNSLSDWSVTTQTGSIAGITYNSSDSYAVDIGSGHVAFITTTSSQYISLLFASAMTNAGGTIGIALTPLGGDISDSSLECANCNPWRAVASGSITASAVAVPEPADSSMLMLGLGLLSLIGFARRARA